MIIQSEENPNSHLTIKERERESLPVRILFERNMLEGKILDFGCGLGKDVEYLRSKNFRVQGYDPYYFPKLPSNKYDTIICFYVLNVLLPVEQVYVIMSISELLNKGGKAFYAVRRDIKRNGFIYNPKRKVRTYQCNVTLPFKSIFRNKNTEIYEYQHYTNINNNKSKVSPFFNNGIERELVTESATAFAIYDNFPVSLGHSLVIPKRLVSNYFDLTFHEQIGCLYVLNRVKSKLEKLYSPDGFNIGLNIGASAGQSIYHSHIHVIPRYKGDVEEPRGGIRCVIPSKQKY